MTNFSLAAELKTMANIIRHMAERKPDALRANGLTAIQCMVIGFLSENHARDVFQRDLEAAFHIRRSTVTGILQGMEQRGLILRQPVAHDARLKKLVLTDAGREIQAVVQQNLREIEERALEGISEEEFLIFCRTLEKMKVNLMKLSLM